MCLTGSRTIFFSLETALNFRRTFRQNESNRNRRLVTLKLLAGFNTQFQKYKKVLNFYLLKESRELGDKSRGILATKTAINFSESYSKMLPAKLTKAQRAY